MDGKMMSWIYGDGGSIHVFETVWNVQNVSLQKAPQTYTKPVFKKKKNNPSSCLFVEDFGTWTG